jgi:hypothetical protein
MRLKTSGHIDLETAETLALQALTFLISDPQRLSRFMALTGIGEDALRDGATSHALQAATLDYLLADESLLLVFCQETGIEPLSVAPARAALSGQAPW